MHNEHGGVGQANTLLPLLYLSSHSLFKRLECNLLTEAKGPQGYTGRLRQNGELSYSIPKTQQQQCLGTREDLNAPLPPHSAAGVQGSAVQLNAGTPACKAVPRGSDLRIWQEQSTLL